MTTRLGKRPIDVRAIPTADLTDLVYNAITLVVATRTATDPLSVIAAQLEAA